MSHVLVIDDSERVRNSVRAMLESAGFDVSVATDGEDGVSQFRQERFDLVISDIVIPRKDGLRTIRELRELTSEIPIVAMSGGMDFALSFAEKLGATRTIAKPFSRGNLLAVVRECMIENASKFFH